MPAKNQPAGDRLNAYKSDAKFNVKLGWTPTGQPTSTRSATSASAARRATRRTPAPTPLVKVRYWQWPYWDKDSVYFVSNTRLGASNYLRGRAFYDTYDNALYSYDDATYTTQVEAVVVPEPLPRPHDRRVGGVGGDAGPSHAFGPRATSSRTRTTTTTSASRSKEFDGRIVSVGVEDTIDARADALARRRHQRRLADDDEGGGLPEGAGHRPARHLPGQRHGLRRRERREPAGGPVLRDAPAASCGSRWRARRGMPSLKDRYSYKFGTAVPNPT